MAKKLFFSGLRITGLVFCVLFIYMSCSINTKPRLTPKHNGIDKEFKPYVQEFIELSGGTLTDEDTKKLNIAFSDQKKEVVGACWRSIGWQEIEVDSFFWKYASPLRKKALMLHELGHCLLSRGHVDETNTVDDFLEKLGIYKPKVEKFADGCPKSLMTVYLLSEKCLRNHMPHYEKELFHNPYYKIKDRIGKQICKELQVVNSTDTWTEKDKATLRSAANTCGTKYNSCLKVFYKDKEREYRAICK